MPNVNNWYVITGAPSSGKSTLIRYLAELGYAVFHETGRLLIDEDMAKGKSLADIQVDSPEFEARFVKAQHEREATLNKKDLIFFDRGVFDTIPFHQFYDWNLSDEIQAICDKSRYNPMVFLLDLVPYEKNYGRIEDEATVKGLQKLAGKAYADRGYKVVSIPPISVKERAEVILKHIEEASA